MSSAAARRLHHPGRARLRLHQRLPRRGQLHRHRGLDPRAHPHAGGGLGGLLQLRGRLRLRGAASPRPSARAWWTRRVVDQWVILGGLIGAIVWNLITWYSASPPARRTPSSAASRAPRWPRPGFGALLPSGLLKIARLHRAGARDRPLPGLHTDGRHALGRAGDPAEPGRLALPSPPARLRGLLQPGPRHQRRAEDDGDHLRSCSSPPAISAPSSTSRSG